MIRSARDLASVRKAIARDSSVSALVINDDIEGTDKEQDTAAWRLTDLLKRTWPTPAWYERPEHQEYAGK
jgi:hypothetical protein